MQNNRVLTVDIGRMGAGTGSADPTLPMGPCHPFRPAHLSHPFGCTIICNQILEITTVQREIDRLWNRWSEMRAVRAITDTAVDDTVCIWSESSADSIAGGGLSYYQGGLRHPGSCHQRHTELGRNLLQPSATVSDDDGKSESAQGLGAAGRSIGQFVRHCIQEWASGNPAELLLNPHLHSYTYPLPPTTCKLISQE
jgi:hypothetical protein